MCKRIPVWKENKKKKDCSGDIGVRTRGLSHAKRALYHWAISPFTFMHRISTLFIFDDVCFIYRHCVTCTCIHVIDYARARACASAAWPHPPSLLVAIATPTVCCSCEDRKGWVSTLFDQQKQFVSPELGPTICQFGSSKTTSRYFGWKESWAVALLKEEPPLPLTGNQRRGAQQVRCYYSAFYRA